MTEEQREKMMHYIQDGMPCKKVAALTGVKINTVKYWQQRMKATEQSGHNADRHLCRTCKFKYGYKESNQGSCDYYVKTDKLRGCAAELCDKYERE